MSEAPYFVHATSVVDSGAEIGEGTRIWHFCHVMSGARIGQNCTLGQNVFVASDVLIGSHVKIQNNVSLYDGIVLEDEVFCGPSCVFTNVAWPRSEFSGRDSFQTTLVRRGATIGANASIVCNTIIGRYAFVAAGAVIARGEVPDYALMIGVPARQAGWVGRHGQRLDAPDREGIRTCPKSGWRYQQISVAELQCLDWPEDKSLLA